MHDTLATAAMTAMMNAAAPVRMSAVSGERRTFRDGVILRPTASDDAMVTVMHAINSRRPDTFTVSVVRADRTVIHDLTAEHGLDDVDGLTAALDAGVKALQGVAA